STASNFTGTQFTSSTINGSLLSLVDGIASPLTANTTYFFQVGARWNDGTTNYANTTPISTSTLATALSAAQIFKVYSTSITANWAALPSNPGSEGYQLDAATDSGFTSIAASSVTTNVNLSTLTVVSLTQGGTYYLRVGGLNWNNVANYANLGSTVTN